MTLKKFKEYIEEGIVKIQSPDRIRANSLKNEAMRSLKVLNNIIETFGINEENTNYIIKNAYDIIMKLIRCNMLLKGYNSKGIGAHEAEVSYLEELGFEKKDIDFANQLRYFRNGILYYGKSFNKEYANKVIEFLNKILEKL